MSQKHQEKYRQMRYKRALERYLNRWVAHVKELSDEALVSFALQSLKKLDEIEKVALYNDYYESLERFVTVTKALVEEQTPIEQVKEKVAHEANQIRKMKRQKQYSRKGKGKELEEGF